MYPCMNQSQFHRKKSSISSLFYPRNLTFFILQKGWTWENNRFSSLPETLHKISPPTSHLASVERYVCNGVVHCPANFPYVARQQFHHLWWLGWLGWLGIPSSTKSRKVSQLTTFEILEEKNIHQQKNGKKTSMRRSTGFKWNKSGWILECCWMTRMKTVAKILDWKATNSFEWTVDTRKPSTYNHEYKLVRLGAV